MNDDNLEKLLSAFDTQNPTPEEKRKLLSSAQRYSRQNSPALLFWPVLSVAAALLLVFRFAGIKEDPSPEQQPKNHGDFRLEFYAQYRFAGLKDGRGLLLNLKDANTEPIALEKGGRWKNLTVKELSPTSMVFENQNHERFALYLVHKNISY